MATTEENIWTDYSRWCLDAENLGGPVFADERFSSGLNGKDVRKTTDVLYKWMTVY